MDTRRFRVALSFSGDERSYVSEVAGYLEEHFGKEQIFYDANYRAELARVDMDLYLQSIYRDQSDIIGLFFSESYKTKVWCGLEWRAIRNLMVERSEDIVPVRMAQAEAPKGLFELDGYLPADRLQPAEVAGDIIKRFEIGYQQIQTAMISPSSDDGHLQKAIVPTAPASLVSALFRNSALLGEYILYVSRDRLAGLFEQVDGKTLELMTNTRAKLPPYRPHDLKGEPERRGVVQQLASVLHFLEETAIIGDLNKIVQEKGELSADWYWIEGSFLAEPLKESTFTTMLTGAIGDHELQLSCSVRNITGVIEEEGRLMPTSMSNMLFRGDLPMNLKGLVRLGAYDRERKRFIGSALYLTVPPFRGRL